MRLPQLDMLRGVAILLVLGHHMDKYTPGTAWAPPAVVQAWLTGGWMGVDLFFVLSGFLVAGLLFAELKKHSNVQVGRFLLRRGFKIYPAFYAFLLVTLVGVLLTGAGVHWAAFLCEACFVQNYGPSIGDHTWSLAVEEHFYLLLSLFVLAQLRFTNRLQLSTLAVAFVVIASGCLAARLWVSWSAPYVNRTHLFPTHLRLDALLFGVLLSYLYHFRGPALAERVRRGRYALLLLGIALVAPSFFLDIAQSFYLHTAGLTCTYLGFGAILLVAVFWPGAGPRPLRRPAALLAVIGFYSYSIYLWHLAAKSWVLTLVRVTVGDGRPLPYLAELGIYVLGSVVVGIVLAKLIEAPFLRWRDRLIPSRGAAVDSSERRGLSPPWAGTAGTSPAAR
jgi:peptidoglycan/LPS O-acetylase OafA/YrhL